MKYVYAAMILQNTDSEINEQNVTEVLEAAGCDVNEHRVKALVNSLEDVDIEEAIENNTVQTTQTTTQETETEQDEHEEEYEETEETQDESDDEEDDEGGDAGLGELFG